ncbi:MAG: hypothetical protein GY940_43860, partial [bacterium]|nr:hypothetical protein [bacterium]
TSLTEPFNFSFSFSKYIVSRPDDNVLLKNESGALLIKQDYGEGTVYLFADNRLFVNRYFTNPHHALYLNRILGYHFDRTFFFHEYGSGVEKVGSPLLILFKGKLLYLMIHLVLLGLIFVAWRSKRFGKPLRVEPFKRRSLNVHLEAVGGFFRKTRAVGIAAELNRKYMIYRVKHLLNLKRNISDKDLMEKLSDYTGKEPGEILGLMEKTATGVEHSLFEKRKRAFRLIADIKQNKRNK